MGRLFKILAGTSLILAILTGCGESKDDLWIKNAGLDKDETVEELYQKALEEDILIVYTVSTRAARTKELFEEQYPGLFVEIRDLRSPDLVEAVEENHNKGLSECDVVLCNDNSGEFKSRLFDKGLVVPYCPSDIASKLKEHSDDGLITFNNEVQILYYSKANFDTCPVKNIWELTEEKYKGRIYMPNPLRSFSTYAFCSATFDHEKEIEDAYREYAGVDLPDPEKEGAAAILWKRIAENMIFTNSSDEVTEALSNGSADLGFAVSSKLRLTGLGFALEPVWKLNPFSGCTTSFTVMIATGSRNINSAKLFVRFIFGEADGKGRGYEPFATEGTWSARIDVPDGTDVALKDTDLITPDQDRIIKRHDEMEKFWSQLLKENALGQ